MGEAPSLEEMGLEFMNPEVATLIRRVRALPYRRGATEPFVNPFDPLSERQPLHTRELARVLPSANKHFLDAKKYRSATTSAKMRAWVDGRTHFISLMSACIHGRGDAQLSFTQLYDELASIRGQQDRVTTLAAEICHACQPYIVLGANVFTLLLDDTFASEYTPLRHMTQFVRSHEEIVDVIALLERAMLGVRRKSEQPRAYLYHTLGVQDPQVIIDLHDNCVRAIRQDASRPYADEVASLLESHLLNAREHSRMAPADQRPAMLSLQNVAFSSGCIGLDRMRAEQHAATKTKSSANKTAEPYIAAPTPATANNRVPRPRGRAAAAVSTGATLSDASNTTPPAAMSNTIAAAPSSPRNANVRQASNPHSDNYAAGLRYDPQDRRSPNARAPPTQQPNNTNTPSRRWYILWRQIQKAGSEDPHTPRGEIARMIWPTDDCSRYNLPLEEAGFPRPTAVMLDPEGKPRLRPDGSEARVYTGVKNACRFCSIWAPKHRINVADPTGGHNPKTCQDAAQMLAKQPGGRDFLAEARGYKN